MIFQWESQSATSYLKQLFSDTTIKKIKEKNPDFSYMDLLSIGNGAIRPAGESYRDRLAQGIYQDIGHEALNNFFMPTLGYCIEENQMVSTVNGRKKISDICVGDEVYTKNGVSTVLKKIHTGQKECLKIHTNSNSILCTNDHKILTQNGWVEANKIRVGDSVAIRVGNKSNKEYDLHKLKLIGYLLGDGMLSSRNNVSFVNRNKDVIDDFCDIVSHFDNCTTSVRNVRSRVNKLDLYYANVKHLIGKKQPTSVAKYLCEIGLKKENGGCVAVNKFIPEFIFSLNQKSLLTFLGAYTDTDCCIKNGDKPIVCYKTSSKRLKDDLVEIIRLAGYVAKVTKDKKNNAYAINICDAINFLKELRNYSFKIQQTYKLEELISVKPGVTNRINKEVIKNNLKKHNISFKKVLKKTGINLYKKSEYISINAIKKIAVCYSNAIPTTFLNENLFWIQIGKIENKGKKNVYDLTINDEHNFICQGMVVHNCVYQEQIIEFLHIFCGYTMGEADVVRRGFAKKTGTEKFIPKIKSGFTKTMKDKFDVSERESEKLIVNFIKVIEDASSYLFSKNHADPYSWIGYICGYLRYYYPLEFITTALNIFEGKEEKSLAIINYAKSQGIKISPIKFRYSIAKYNFNKDTNEIYKGISSIKYMNANVADEIYSLRENRYKNFISLMYDLKKKTSINSRQLKILIELDFFSEFGDVNRLLKLCDLFDSCYGKKQFNKEKLDSIGISIDIIRHFAENETDKMFTKVDTKGLLEFVAAEHIEYQNRTLKEKVQAQITHLGYVDTVDESYNGMAAVLSVDTKYAPKLKMYSLKNGTIIDCKIKKNHFLKNKLQSGDIVRIYGQKKEPKLKRLENGDYEPIPGTYELWLTGYAKVEDI